jgi:Ca2+-binding EF-hand superfamily protein
MLELCCLWQAVAVAGLLVTIVEKDQPWGTAATVSYFIAWMAPIYQWNVLLPKVVTKLAIVTAVEYMKDPHIIAEISAEVKKKRVRETLKLLRIIKLEGRAARLTEGTPDGKIPTERFAKCMEKFGALPKKKQSEMEGIFKVFDSDNSGHIDREEMMQVLASMGIVSHSAEESVTRLLGLVDRDNSGEIDLDEFKVLMILSVEKPSHDEQEQDMHSFFEKFDEDGSGEVSIKEMVDKFAELGCPMDEAEVREMVYETFRKPVENLDMQHFGEWLRHTEAQHADDDEE